MIFHSLDDLPLELFSNSGKYFAKTHKLFSNYFNSILNVLESDIHLIKEIFLHYEVCVEILLSRIIHSLVPSLRLLVRSSVSCCTS